MFHTANVSAEFHHKKVTALSSSVNVWRLALTLVDSLPKVTLGAFSSFRSETASFQSLKEPTSLEPNTV